MPVKLDATDIVNSFKNRLALMGFIPHQYHADIAKRLDILIDIKNGVKRKKSYTRLAKTEAAHWLWENLLLSSLSSITNNLRGYYELKRYFTEYISYENLLFAVDRRHRDHVIHCIWVMLIGFYLLEKCKPLSPIDYSSILLKSSPGFKDPPNMKACENGIKQREPVLWFLISLTHDLGYPIQKTREANTLMSSMIDNFGFLEQQHFTYNFTTLQNTPIEELFNILSSTLFFNSNTNHKVVYSSGVRLDFAKSFERLDHGIMSAYLLTNYLDYICDTMDCPSHPDISLNSATNALPQAIVILWLTAIAAHTSKNRYWDALNARDVLLVLADELDEFSRYSHDVKLDRWVSVSCQTSFTCTKKSIHFEYIFPSNPEFDHLTFFTNKVIKLMNRFQLQPGGIELVSVTSTHLKPQKNKWHYEKRFPDIEGTVRKINHKKKTVKDIHKWIAGEEVL
jgi:hypothetical protein